MRNIKFLSWGNFFFRELKENKNSIYDLWHRVTFYIDICNFSLTGEIEFTFFLLALANLQEWHLEFFSIMHMCVCLWQICNIFYLHFYILGCAYGYPAFISSIFTKILSSCAKNTFICYKFQLHCSWALVVACIHWTAMHSIASQRFLQILSYTKGRDRRLTE